MIWAYVGAAWLVGGFMLWDAEVEAGAAPGLYEMSAADYHADPCPTPGRLVSEVLLLMLVMMPLYGLMLPVWGVILLVGVWRYRCPRAARP